MEELRDAVEELTLTDLATTEQGLVKAEQPSVMDMIAQIASDPNVNVDVMGKLVDLQLKIDEQIQVQALNAALAKLEPLLKTLPKSKAGARTKTGQTKYYYTPYQDIDKMLRPALRECGLVLSFDTRTVGDKVFFCARVQEVTKGGFREALIPYAPDANDQLNGPQKVASGVSYAQRYAVKMLFNLVTDDAEDDNGEAAGAISDAQFGKLQKMLKECGDEINYEAFVSHVFNVCGVKDLALIPKANFAEIEGALQQRLNAIRKSRGQ